MKYTITITAEDTKTVTRRGEHTVIDRVPWPESELTEAVDKAYGYRDKFLERNPLKEVRGYAPSYQATETVTAKVYEQTVSELDLAAVIKAVNRIA